MNKPVKKRIRKNESSCRLVECYYCGAKKEYKDLKSHCKHVHNKPLRQNGQLTIYETFFQPAKRAKTAHPIVKPEPDESDPLSLTEISVPEKSVDPEKPSAPDQPESVMSSVVTKLTGMLFALTTFLDPLRAIVSSLETSSKRIEESLAVKRNELEKREHQLSTIHQFHCQHSSEGLVLSNSGATAVGYCSKCMKFEHDIKDVPYFDSDWTKHGKKLTYHHGRQWSRHVNSRMHIAALDIEKSRNLGSMFTAQAIKAKEITFNFLRISYACICMYVPYRKFTILNVALSLSAFAIGNRHHGEKAAAAAVDMFYDFFFKRLSRFVATLNPCTNRPRLIFTSADKGTELNQRQVINMTMYDVDGRSINIHLTAHLINDIDLEDGEAEETTAKALLQHHYVQIGKMGLTLSDIKHVWFGDVTDKEASYLLMGKLAQKDISGFISVADAAHGIESLFDDVEKKLPWFDKTLSIIDKVYGRYAHSPKRKRKLRRTAVVFKTLHVTLKRIIETRYVKFSALAGDALIAMLRILVAVLEDDVASARGDDAKAVGLLRTSLLSKTAVPHLMCLLDVLDHAISFSCCGQSEKFGVFYYLDQRRRLIQRINIFAQDGFNVNVKIPNSEKYLSARLHKFEAQIRSLVINTVKLGTSRRINRRSIEQDGDAVFDSCIKWQQKLANSILSNLHRLPETNLFLSMEIIIHPLLILKAEKPSEYYREHLERICDAFDCMSLIASVAVGHDKYLSIIRDVDSQQHFDKYWKRNNKWDPMGVIESFMNPSFQLATDIEDYVWVMAKIGLIRFTQSDTERVVKTVSKTETRFTGYDEVKESEGKRDRAKQEVFLRENQVPLTDLPLEALNKEWLKSHLPALKSKSKRDVTVENYISNDTPKHQFWKV